MTGPTNRRPIGGAALVIGIVLAACGGAGASTSGSVPATVAPSPNAQPSASPVAAATIEIPADHRAPVAAVGAQLIGAGPLALDPAGNLYLAECDWTHAAVHRIDPSGTMTTYAGMGVPGFDGDAGLPATSSRMFCVADVRFGPDGALYIDDHLNNRIRRVDASGTMTTVAGSGAVGLDAGSYSGDGGPAPMATLQEPWAIAFDAAGNLYIADRDNHRIRKVDGHGVITTIAGNGKGGFSGDGGPGSQASINLPLAIVVDGEGNVVFTDSANQRVRRIDHGTGVITTIAGTGKSASTGDGGPATKASLADPQSLIFDTSGNLYIEETAPLAFRRIDKAGRISTVQKIGGVPIKASQVPGFNGWLFDSAGDLYVTDAASVLRFEANGSVTLIAGVR